MNDFTIAATASSPFITANWTTGTLSMRGDSYPENAHELFDRVIDWVRRFLAEEQRPLMLGLHLLYLNTSSVKAMMDIFDLLEAAHHAGRTVRVVWYYDAGNERAAELAEEFREDCTFPFEITSSEEPA
jgi:hypothetical protein